MQKNRGTLYYTTGYKEIFQNYQMTDLQFPKPPTRQYRTAFSLPEEYAEDFAQRKRKSMAELNNTPFVTPPSRYYKISQSRRKIIPTKK